MSILMYVPRDNKAGEELLRQLDGLIKDSEVEIVDLLASLGNRLRQPRKMHDIAVLMPPDELSLEWIFELYLDHFMDDLQLVIILPEQNDLLLKIAHRMYPRYLTDVNGDFSDIEATLYNLQINACLKKFNFN